MSTTRDIRNAGTLILLMHLAVLLAHALAHRRQNIATSSWQDVFIAIVIFSIPLLAVIILWTRKQTLGLSLLGISMAGSLIFGLYYHFVAAGADNIFVSSQAPWSTAFRTTAVLLGAIETLGCIWCYCALRRRWLPRASK